MDASNAIIRRTQTRRRLSSEKQKDTVCKGAKGERTQRDYPSNLHVLSLKAFGFQIEFLWAYTA